MATVRELMYVVVLTIIMLKKMNLMVNQKYI